MVKKNRHYRSAEEYNAYINVGISSIIFVSKKKILPCAGGWMLITKSDFNVVPSSLKYNILC